MGIDITFYKVDESGGDAIHDYGQFNTEFPAEVVVNGYIDLEKFEELYGFDYDSAWTVERDGEVMFFDYNENVGLFDDEDNYRKFCKLKLRVEELACCDEEEYHIKVKRVDKGYLGREASNYEKVSGALDKIYDKHDCLEFDRETFQKIINTYKTLSFWQNSLEGDWDIVYISY
jgi:hypothetical protein